MAIKTAVYATGPSRIATELYKMQGGAVVEVGIAKYPDRLDECFRIGVKRPDGIKMQLTLSLSDVKLVEMNDETVL